MSKYSLAFHELTFDTSLTVAQYDLVEEETLDQGKYLSSSDVDGEYSRVLYKWPADKRLADLAAPQEHDYTIFEKYLLSRCRCFLGRYYVLV